MDWLLPIALVGGIVWLCSKLLDASDQDPEQCARCGGPMEMAPESLELLRAGLGLGLTSVCAVCGSSRTLASQPGSDGW